MTSATRKILSTTIFPGQKHRVRDTGRLSRRPHRRCWLHGGGFSESSLADLYDPLAMPPDLAKAHQHLDRAVDVAYGYKGARTDAERVSFLFGLYEK